MTRKHAKQQQGKLATILNLLSSALHLNCKKILRWNIFYIIFLNFVALHLKFRGFALEITYDIFIIALLLLSKVIVITFGYFQKIDSSP